MRSPRAEITANGLDGKIYVTGGMFTPWGGCSRAYSTEVYDPKIFSWNAETLITIAVSSYSSAVVDNKIYIFGGQMGESLTQI